MRRCASDGRVTTEEDLDPSGPGAGERTISNPLIQAIDVAGAGTTFSLSLTRKASSMNEIQLGEAAAKAARAQDLLDDELLIGAFKSLEDSYTSAWRASSIDDVAAREKLFLAINVVGKVRDHLATIVTNGRLAQAELKELARTAERRRRFGIV
jgi:hypothetical protein